jgi:hypothetical protein
MPDRRGANRGGNNNGGHQGRSGGCGNGGRDTFNNNNASKPKCQVCFKGGHTALECWYRFDKSYTPATKTASAAMSNYGVDSNWYTDTGATDHITRELNKLVVHDVYNGADQIKTASGAGMTINHIGQAIVPTPSRNLHLNNVLHVPEACKNPVSVHHLATDNNAFLEFHPDFFLIKDQATKTTLLRGK